MSLISDLRDNARFLTQTELGELLRINQSTISQWQEDGKLPGVYRIFGNNKLTRIDSGEIADWLVQWRVSPEEEVLEEAEEVIEEDETLDEDEVVEEEEASSVVEEEEASVEVEPVPPSYSFEQDEPTPDVAKMTMAELRASAYKSQDCADELHRRKSQLQPVSKA